MELIEERRRILLNTPHIETISTNTFKTDMVAPFKKLEVRFEPVQDLHGYDSPWPAGGGVNKWDEQLEYGRINLTSGAPTADKNYKRSVNFCACLPQTSYYGKAPQTPSTFVLAFYDANKSYLGYLATAAVRNTVFTTPENAYFFKLYASEDHTSEIAINYPSTVTTQYYPYSNICPISGWTGVNVSACGKNLYSSTDTIVLSKPEETGSPRTVTKYINPIPEGTYRFSGKLTTTNNTKISIIFQYRGAIAVTSVMKLDTDFDLSVTFNHEVTRFYVYIPQSYPDGTATLSDIQIELGSTATAYEPYQGTTYPISWQTEAGTVYGGNLDVTTGLLTVTMASVDLGTLNYGLNNHATLGQYFWCDVYSRNIKRAGDYGTTVYPSICSAFKCVPRNTREFVNSTYCFDGSADRVTQIQFKDSAYSDATSFKTAMSGVQLVYPLATPQTYQLTPQQILTLKNNNTLMSEGSINELKYWTHI